MARHGDRRPKPGYRDRLYSTYVTTNLGEQEWGRAAVGLRQDIVRHLPPDRTIDILDLGCGHGDLIEVLRDAGYRSICGVDGSPEQVELAHWMGRPEVEQGNLFAYLADHPSTFDAIVAVDVLEHFRKDEVLEVLDAVHLALRSGGRIVVRTPNGSGPFAGRTRYWDFTHEVAFTLTSMTQVLRATGFEEIRVLPSEPAPHGFLSLSRLILWRLFSLPLKLGLAAETGVVRGHILTQNLVAVADRAADAADAP